MRVYRVEKLQHPDDCIGDGAFVASLAMEHDAAARAFDPHTGGVYSMPTPLDEPKGSPVHHWAARAGHDHMRFGFESVRSYALAFCSAEGRAAMDAAGGVLSVYEVPREHIMIGVAQVIFDWRHAVRVETRPCVIME